ncbi:MAG: hypothetical protein OEX08_03120 [Candidatus Nomurabacteria bacterium]|nr:hypothetical protein [Candidatus Nomurabacteria bacterium]
MKKLIIPILLIAIVVLVFALVKTKQIDTNPFTKLRECPDVYAADLMPPNKIEYYIVDGERREASEYDREWVKENCDLEYWVSH